MFGADSLKAPIIRALCWVSGRWYRPVLLGFVAGLHTFAIFSYAALMHLSATGGWPPDSMVVTVTIQLFALLAAAPIWILVLLAIAGFGVQLFRKGVVPL